VSVSVAELIGCGRAELEATHGAHLTGAHRRALDALTACRSEACGTSDFACPQCAHTVHCPRSCAHRSCPVCQHHLGVAWLERQQAKRLPVAYFLVTFTLPAALRALAYRNPRVVYHALFQAGAETLQTFATNHPKLQGRLGATAVLHTHNRRLDYHPHAHFIVPALAVDTRRRQWRRLDARYLANGRALACVFRAKLLARLRNAALDLPDELPKRWVAHCTRVGNGAPALQYLARYLYRGVVRERDIVHFDRARRLVTVRYHDAKAKQWRTRTLALVDFLFQLMVHVLPPGLRRVREYGLLHHNARRLRALLQLLLQVRLPPSANNRARTMTCPQCGAPMRFVCVHPPVPHGA